MNLERYINQYLSYHYLVIPPRRKETVVVQSDLFYIVERDPELILYKHKDKPCYIWVIDSFCTAVSVDKVFNVPFTRFNGFLSSDPDWIYLLRKYNIRSFPDLSELMSHIENNIPMLLNKLRTIRLNSVYGLTSASYEAKDQFCEIVTAKKYCEEDIKRVNEMYGIFSTMYEERKNTMNKYFEIKNVIFNDPATIIFWKDGTKTVTKCGEKDIYDPEKGLAMCLAKRALGDKGNYYETFKKWLPEETTEKNKRYGDVTFTITSVDLASTTDKATEPMRELHDALAYDGHKEAKNYIAENKYGDRYDTRLFFAGKKHKIVCAGDCYHVKNIKKENSLVYFTLKDAINDGCIPCKHCEGMHKTIIPEGLVRSCRNCKHRKNCSSFLPCYNPETNVFERFEEDK